MHVRSYSWVYGAWLGKCKICGDFDLKDVKGAFLCLVLKHLFARVGERGHRKKVHGMSDPLAWMHTERCRAQSPNPIACSAELGQVALGVEATLKPPVLEKTRMLSMDDNPGQSGSAHVFCVPWGR